jgi:hypothetical protein
VINDATSTELGKFDTVINKQDGAALQTQRVASGATQILSDVQEMIYPFKDVEWAYELRFNLQDPRLAGLRTFLREKESSHPAGSLGDGEAPTPFYELFSQRDNRMQADQYGEPRIYTDKENFFVVAGPLVLVDLFDSAPQEGRPLSKWVRSAKYSVRLKLILDPSRLRKENSNKESERLAGFPYQLIYYPSQEGKPDSDELFVDYYRWVPDYLVFRQSSNHSWSLGDCRDGARCSARGQGR